MGPLTGLRVVELAGIGPGPFAGMMLADMGAEVVRVDRAGAPPGVLGLSPEQDVLGRGRRSVAVDLKVPEGVEVVLRLVERSDALIEGFRPGVAERLGVGPEPCRMRNPGLVYGRMTGWGQEGPWAPRAGHDLDYVALAGALHPIGPGDRSPAVPLNYVADFGGGGMFLAFGIACALWERERSGRGQVVDAAMVDGAAAMTAMVHGMRAMGLWQDARERNLLDGAAPFYRTYTCADERFVAVAALEPHFYAQLLDGLGLEPGAWPQHDRTRWPAQSRAMAQIFAGRRRDEWEAVFEGTDACVAPVLSPTEAPQHPHMAARGTFARRDGLTQPAPAPRFSRTAAVLSRPPASPGQHTDEVLAEFGFGQDEVEVLRDGGAVE